MQFEPIVRRPPERHSGDEAVPDFEVVNARFGPLPGFGTEVKYGTRTCNARAETVATLASFESACAGAGAESQDRRQGALALFFTNSSASNRYIFGHAQSWPWEAQLRGIAPRTRERLNRIIPLA